MSGAAPDTMALLNVYQPSRLLTSSSCLATPPGKGGHSTSAHGIIGLVQRHFADVPLTGRPRASFDDTKGLLLLRRCESERVSEREKPHCLAFLSHSVDASPVVVDRYASTWVGTGATNVVRVTSEVTGGWFASPCASGAHAIRRWCRAATLRSCGTWCVLSSPCFLPET